jgi:hypothetical protein
MRTLRRMGTLLLLAAWARCQDPAGSGAFVRVLLEDVPSGAESAVVYTFFDEVLANEVLRVPLNGQASFSFGLRLPVPSSGTMTSSVGIVNSQGCLLASATGGLKVSPEDELLGLSLRMRATVPAPLCTNGRAALTAAEPAQISTAGRSMQQERVPLRLRGWGFRPGAEVSIGGRAQTGVRVLSAEEILIERPDTTVPLGPARIAVTIRDQPAVTRDDLLSVFVEPVGLRLITTATGSPTDPILDVAAGDLSGDRRDELVLLDARGALSIYLNTGGQLALGQKLQLSLPGLDGNSAGSVAIGDVTGDGVPELVVTSTAGTVVVERQAGGMYGQLRVSPELRARDVALARVISASSLDLVLAGDDIAIYRDRGIGLFASPPDARYAASTESIQVADMNGDGAMDIVAATTAGDLQILSSENGALRAWFQLPVRSGCLSWPARVFVADLDNDRTPDIAVNGSSQLLLRRGSGFAPRYIDGVAPCFGGSGLAVADFNRDGLADILWILGSSTVVLPGTLGKTSSQMLSGISIPSSAAIFAPNGPRHVPRIDLTGDGGQAVAVGIGILGSVPLP